MRAFKDDRNRAYNDVFPLPAGDVNVSVLYPGTIKAFHRHKLQDDYWFVARGNIRAVLADDVRNVVSVQYLSEGDKPLFIPRGIWHGLQVLGNEEAMMIYYITNSYNPAEPDEERAPWDKFYSWEISRK